MASKPPGLEGVHFVRRALSGGRVRWHVYAWRGGPPIMVADTVLKPALTPEAVAAFHAAHATGTKRLGDTFGDLVDAYLGSQAYLGNAASTKRDYKRWCESAKDEFGNAGLRVFSDPRIRRDIIAWRDRWADKPRSAYYAMQVLKVVLYWGVEGGWLATNPAEAISSKYKTNRAEIIWTDDEINAVAAKMRPHVACAFRLASWTGLARGDVVSLRWNEIFDYYIDHKRQKTGVQQIVPLFDETRALLEQFPKTAVTVVTSSRRKPFSARGFAEAVERARDVANVAKGKTLHDLRGTFATRLMYAGFDDREIDEMLGWETGKSSLIRRKYISRRAVAMAGIDRMRERLASAARAGAQEPNHAATHRSA